MDVREFVTSRWHALLRTGYLLTGDLDVARQRLTAALADVAGSVRRGATADPEFAVLAVLARATVRAAGELSEPEPAIAGSGSDNSAEPAGARLWRALRGMPATARVVLVLEAYAELDAGTVARLLRVRENRLAEARRDAYARVAAALPDERERADLVDLLHARASDVPLDAAPYAGLAPLLTARRRRGVLVAVAAAVVLALLATGYGVTAAGRSARDTRASGDVLSWPARGGLASDAALIDAVSRRVPDGHVVYADDVRGARIVLALSPNGAGELALVALQGAAGTPGDLLRSTAEGTLSPSARVVAWADPDSPAAPLVVLAPSAASVVAVSLAPRVRPGAVDRAYAAEHPRSGVWVGVADSPSVHMIRVSVSGPSGTLYDGPVQGIDRAAFYPGADPPEPEHGYGTPVDRQAWTAAAAEIAATYRVRYADLRVVWRWTRKEAPRTALVVAAYRLPNDAVVLQVRWRSRDLGDGVAVNRYVLGRPLGSADEPVAWRAGGRIGVLYPGHPGARVLLGDGSMAPPSVTTDRTGYAELPAVGSGDFIRVTGDGYEVHTSATSPYDQDPLAVGRPSGP